MTPLEAHRAATLPKEQDGCPVVLVGTPHEFRSIRKAARWLSYVVDRHVWPNTIREAIEHGRPAYGRHWRYADMPESCQPLKRSWRRPVVRLRDGQTFPSILAAAGHRRKWMRLYRAIGNGTRFRGSRWAYADLPIDQQALSLKQIRPRGGAGSSPRPVVRLSDGQRFGTIQEAVHGDKRLWMQLSRAIDAGKPWNGSMWMYSSTPKEAKAA